MLMEKVALLQFSKRIGSKRLDRARPMIAKPVALAVISARFATMEWSEIVDSVPHCAAVASSTPTERAISAAQCAKRAQRRRTFATLATIPPFCSHSTNLSPVSGSVHPHAHQVPSKKLTCVKSAKVIVIRAREDQPLAQAASSQEHP